MGKMCENSIHNISSPKMNPAKSQGFIVKNNRLVDYGQLLYISIARTTTNGGRYLS